MLQLCKLLLPALFPSWRFFAVISPSPRVQYALLSKIDEIATEWTEFRPRPARLSFLQILARLFWNPIWNESLFLVSCAERILENPTSHSEVEIITRIIAELKNNSGCHQLPTHIQFRLLVVHRHGSTLQQEICFRSQVRLIDESHS